MICKYLTSNLSLKKKKSSIYFILFPTLMVTVAHILAQKQTSIYVYTYFVYKHSRITKEKKQVMVHFCVDFCLNLSDKQIFFDFTIALSIWELIKIFISNLLIIALNHFIYFEIVEYEINFVGILHSFVCFILQVNEISCLFQNVK